MQTAARRSTFMRTFDAGMKHGILLGLMLVSAVAFADPAVDAATSRLSHAGVFAFGGVGIAGWTSQGEKDFRVILSQAPEIADAAFRRVLYEGTIEAKCYAVVGLSILHPDELEVLLAQLRAAGNVVQTQAGCIMSRQPVAEIMEQIGSYQLRATDYRVKSPGTAQSTSPRSR
jgi:hypothetical protein